MVDGSPECVARQEGVDHGCASQHIFDVGDVGSAILHAIAQALGCLLETFHRLVDVVFCSAAIDPVPIDRLIEIGAKGSDARIHTGQQVCHLLIADAIRSLLCSQDHTDTREREHGRESDNVTSFGHDGPASIQS
jgi:hypothetical protein